MNLPVFFEENISLQNGLLTLQEETGHHIHQVLRLRPGDRIAVTNGKGIILQGSITSMLGKKAVFAATEEIHIPRPAKTISIGISILKNPGRFEWFIEKAVEIGVSQIIPVLSRRTEKTGFRKKRLQQIMIAALLQSQQAWLPELLDPMPFSKVLTHVAADFKFIAHCDKQEKQSLAQQKTHGCIQLLIGPEGDFTREEIAQALQENFIPVSLGVNRLRTETAGIVSLVMLHI